MGPGINHFTRRLSYLHVFWQAVQMSPKICLTGILMVTCTVLSWCAASSGSAANDPKGEDTVKGNLQLLIVPLVHYHTTADLCPGAFGSHSEETRLKSWTLPVHVDQTCQRTNESSRTGCHSAWSCKVLKENGGNSWSRPLVIPHGGGKIHQEVLLAVSDTARYHSKNPADTRFEGQPLPVPKKVNVRPRIVWYIKTSHYQPSICELYDTFKMICALYHQGGSFCFLRQ